jgi:hypothetical protein
MKHKNKYIGILDKDGVKINNGDDVLVHYSNYTYNCKVVYKQGWKLVSTDGTKNGEGFDVYAWRKSIQVVKTDNESVFITHNLQELKDKWVEQNVSFLITGNERKLIHKCFEDAFKLGQEQLKEI